MFSVVRITIGICSSASAITPAQPEKCPSGDDDRIDEQADHDRRRRQQDVVDEADRAREQVLLAVFGEIDAGQDADRRADQRASRHSSRLPTIALARPPPVVFGAGVIS
jgi:hypothetical protein